MIELTLLALAIYVLISHPPFGVGWGEYDGHPLFKKHPGQEVIER